MNLEISGKHMKVTRFICHELLYELLTGRLDPEKRAEMEAFISSDKESQRELERLDRGMTYAEEMRKVRVSQDLHDALMDFEPHWKRVLWTWTMASTQRGWKVLPYFFIAGALILGLIVTKPWRASRSEVVLVEQPKKDVMMAPDGAAPAKSPEIATPTRPTPMGPALSATEVPAAVPTQFVDLTPKSAPSLTTTAASANEDPEPEPAGWVYRAQMEVGNFTDTWNAVRDQIDEMDGKPATDAELATLAKPDEAVFNFSLPESKKEDLTNYLKTFGPVRFHKVHDPRVMPDGEIRIILTIKDNGETKDDSQNAEEPAPQPAQSAQPAKPSP